MATSALPAEAQMDFANESISLLADNIWNEVIRTDRSQEVLKICPRHLQINLTFADTL
jgi:hypothetical protein